MLEVYCYALKKGEVNGLIIMLEEKNFKRVKGETSSLARIALEEKKIEVKKDWIKEGKMEVNRYDRKDLSFRERYTLVKREKAGKAPFEGCPSKTIWE